MLITRFWSWSPLRLHPDIQEPSSDAKVRSLKTRFKMEHHMTCVGPHPDVDTLEYPKAQVEGCSWGEYRLIPRFGAVKFTVRLAVAMAGLAMAFATIPAVQTSGGEAQPHHLRQPRRHLALDFLHGCRDIDPESYLPFDKSLNISVQHSLPTTETLARHIQNCHDSARMLAAFTNHDLPCALRGPPTDDKVTRLRLVLSHGYKLVIDGHTQLTATIERWHDASSPYYHDALKEAEAVRDKARMPWHQIAIVSHQPIPYWTAYGGAWRRQNSAQIWLDEVSSILVNYEADGESLVADGHRIEKFATVLFTLMVSLDNGAPGPWGRTDALALKTWYFHKLAEFGEGKWKWASFEAEWDGLDCGLV